MNKSLFTIIGIAVITVIGLYASTFEHKIDAALMMYGSLAAVVFVAMTTRSAFGVSVLISTIVTIWAVWAGLFTTMSMSETFTIASAMWILTAFRVIPFFVSLVLNGMGKLISKKTAAL
ncbi:hypothetical protein ACCE15_19240 [Pseudomonas parafulva]|uniref:hypothetical protein n=1 Tax=Pseudomonas parafulva TaxID=157782 RepID=UPI0035623D7C